MVIKNVNISWLCYYSQDDSFSPCNYVFPRDEFNLKLTLLSNQWQGVIRRAQQRRGIIDSQIRQWQRYRAMAEKLRKWLVEVSYLPMNGLGSVPVPLQQVRTLFDEVQVRKHTVLNPLLHPWSQFKFSKVLWNDIEIRNNTVIPCQPNM